MSNQLNVKERKRTLYRELSKTDADIARGKRISGITLTSIFILRAVLTLYETIFFSTNGKDTSVWTYVLAAVGAVMLLMIYDGNRAFAYIITLAAAVHILYHFSSVHEAVEAFSGADIYTSVSIIVFILQFILSLFITVSPKAKKYLDCMQTINLKIRGEMLGKK